MKLKLKEFILENEKGGKVKVSFENFSPEEIAAVIKKLQDAEPTREDKPDIKRNAKLAANDNFDSMSIRKKLELIVREIKHGWFTSDHIRELYFYHFHEEIKPSTVSTYLARMFNDEVLERRGSRARREYRVAEKQIDSVQYVDQI